MSMIHVNSVANRLYDQMLAQMPGEEISSGIRSPIAVALDDLRGRSYFLPKDKRIIIGDDGKQLLEITAVGVGSLQPSRWLSYLGGTWNPFSEGQYGLYRPARVLHSLAESRLISTLSEEDVYMLVRHHDTANPHKNIITPYVICTGQLLIEPYTYWKDLNTQFLNTSVNSPGLEELTLDGWKKTHQG